VVYVFARDPGGGENIEVIEKGAVIVLIGSNQAGRSSLSSLSSSVEVEHVTSERSLLLRIASIVKMKDPDILLSWDTQGSGIGYLVERGLALGKSVDGRGEKSSSADETRIDIARLLGRIPKGDSFGESNKIKDTKQDVNLFNGAGDNDDIHAWTGSGLGSEWDDRVGAGAAAASIDGRIVICGWKICSEECKHPNASYQPAIVATVLNKRIPFHDDLLLTRWYSMENGLQRWRVIEYRLLQAMSNVLLLDELDVLGRAGEAARLSGVEFSQSLPGIRGSQYKVEGVLLRALQSVRSNERGEKKGVNTSKASSWHGTALTTTLSAYTTESQSQTQSPWKEGEIKQGKRTALLAEILDTSSIPLRKTIVLDKKLLNAKH
jgi:DNA polymerase zeta